MQYISWPDHGVPQQSSSLVSFIHRVRAVHPPDCDVPLLVHCSAGVGRSGTFITLDSMMLQIKAKSTLYIYGFVEGMRDQRPRMVQNIVSMAQFTSKINSTKLIHANGFR